MNFLFFTSDYLIGLKYKKPPKFSILDWFSLLGGCHIINCIIGLFKSVLGNYVWFLD